MVDVCLQWNTRVCAICGQCYGVHSDLGAYCPSPASEGPVYLQTTFAELHCEAKTTPAAVSS